MPRDRPVCNALKQSSSTPLTPQSVKATKTLMARQGGFAVRGLIDVMRTAKAEGGMMASDDRVELVIEKHAGKCDGRVRLSAFMSQLQSLSATLSVLDREVS